MTSELYLLFWSLSLYDIHVPKETYRARISFLQSKSNALQRGIDDPTKRKREIGRSYSVINALETELTTQQDHCEHIVSDLKARRNTLLSAVVNQGVA